MQITALIPLLALLAAPIADAHSHDGAAGRRHVKHVRAGEGIAKAMARREQLAQENPRAIRKVKRGANGCRVKGSNFTASASATISSTSTVISSTSAASAATTDITSAATAVGGNYVETSSAASSPSSAAAAASSSASSSSGSSVSSGGLSPGNKKAGASGTDSLQLLSPHISWFWNYGPTSDTDDSSLTFVPTLWGNGQQGSQDSSRLSSFESINWNPSYVQGFYEPDCLPPMSSAIDPYTAAALWSTTIAPWKSKGAQLVSPGMCKQADEDWLTPFKGAIGDNMWDITSIHINKLDMDGAKKDIDHYWNTYGKPIWVTEFALVDDSNGFTPVEDQTQINQYINDIVDLLQSDDRVYAYSMSEGEGLAYNWAPVRDGALTESGQTYLAAISKYS